jgi:PTH2 family peptidyl-tRNA hydrolase
MSNKKNISVLNSEEIENYKMYIFVNSELGMGKGKIASQVGHAVHTIIDDIYFNIINGVKKYKQIFEDYSIWKEENGSAKIVLKATTSELEILKKMSYAKYVCDAGKTQIEPGSLTVVIFFPMNSKKLRTDLSSFKLL